MIDGNGDSACNGIGRSSSKERSVPPLVVVGMLVAGAVACGDPAAGGDRSGPHPAPRAGDGTPEAVAPEGWSSVATIDVGELPRRVGTHRVVWQVRNPRAAAHSIVSVVAACAHASAWLPEGNGTGSTRSYPLAQRLPLVLAPGEVRDLELELDLERVPGSVDGHVTLGTDDPLAREVIVGLRGRVNETLLVQPARHRFPSVSRGQPLDDWVTFQVRRSDSLPFRIVDLKHCARGVFADFHAKSDDRTTWIVRAQLLGIAEEGAWSGSIRFATDDGALGVIRLQGHVQETVTFEPGGALMLGLLRPGGPGRAVVSIRSREASVQLARPLARWVPAAGIDLDPTLETEQPGPQEVRVILSVRAPEQGVDAAGRALRGRLEIELPELGILRELEVYGFVRPGS